MKIGKMELSGITKVMFYRKNLFERMPTGKGGFYWYDGKRCKYISDKDIVEVINGCNNNPKKHVWSHGDTINVIRRDQDKKAVVITCNPCKSMPYLYSV